MFDSGVFREKNNNANAMIKQHFVRAFERGARRGHRTNTGLKTDACEVIFDTEDSNNRAILLSDLPSNLR